MKFTALSLFLLLSFTLASFIPDQDIDAEWNALNSRSLQSRAQVNKPITEEEFAALKEAGLFGRDAGGLEARDRVMNCGHTVSGKGGSNGNGKWIRVPDFAVLAKHFCSWYQGMGISKGHEITETYMIKLSNGKQGTIIFAIYNTEYAGSWIVDFDTCYNSMIAPLGDYNIHGKRGNTLISLEKRDNCYGTKNHDYEGGYYKVDTIGAFGSEIYAVK